jgi:hypothetical protein
LSLNYYPFFGFIQNPDALVFINGEQSMESFKWLYNIVILTLYLLTIDSLQSINLDDAEEMEEDIDTDLKLLERQL